MNRVILVLTSSVLMFVSEIAANPTELVYRNSFDTPESLDDWVMEGPGVAEIKNGRLMIHSQWQKDVVSIKDQISLKEPGGEKYYSFIEQWVREREPQNLSRYLQPDYAGESKVGKFAGGHIQFWNKYAHPENFIIRLKFQAASPYPLHMVTFCGRGLNGEDVLAPALRPRFGLATQYMQSDIQNYRISFWSGTRGTTNMRRAPGRKLTAEDAADIGRHALDRDVQLELIRWNGRVVFKADGQTLTDWTDDKPFEDGFFSLRLMAAAKGWYDEYEVYRLNENPFSYTDLGQKISSRLSAQRDVPKPSEVIEDKFIVVGTPEPKTFLHRDIINTYRGHPVHRFIATPEANRVELTTAYGSNLEGISANRIRELSALANLYAHNDQGHYGDTITYEWHAQFPEPLKEDTGGIFAQWHGRPDRTLVETPAGELKVLSSTEFLKLLETTRFVNETGYRGVDIATGEPNGWKSDGSSGGPIAAFKFQDGHMCLLVRNDPYARSDNRVRIKPKPVVRRNQQIGNKSGAVVYELPISEVPINQWIHFKVQIKFSTYRLASNHALDTGFVKVWIDGEQVADWKGNIGKNDEKGPYFKYGIYKPGADGFQVNCAGFRMIIDQQAPRAASWASP